jgi:hypothetical protein
MKARVVRFIADPYPASGVRTVAMQGAWLGSTP